MLKTPKPKNLRELIPFLRECPQVTVQSRLGRKKTNFVGYDNGYFEFAEGDYNFRLHDKENREAGLTIGDKGFIVVCGDKSTTYYFGKSEA